MEYFFSYEVKLRTICIIMIIWMYKGHQGILVIHGFLSFTFPYISDISLYKMLNGPSVIKSVIRSIVYSSVQLLEFLSGADPLYPQFVINDLIFSEATSIIDNNLSPRPPHKALPKRSGGWDQPQRGQTCLHYSNGDHFLYTFYYEIHTVLVFYPT